jgi:ferredoxin-NADP reductase
MARYVQQNSPNRHVSVLYGNQDPFRLAYESFRTEFRG